MKWLLLRRKCLNFFVRVAFQPHPEFIQTTAVNIIFSRASLARKSRCFRLPELFSFCLFPRPGRWRGYCQCTVEAFQLMFAWTLPSTLRDIHETQDQLTLHFDTRPYQERECLKITRRKTFIKKLTLKLNDCHLKVSFSRYFLLVPRLHSMACSSNSWTMQGSSQQKILTVTKRKKQGYELCCTCTSFVQAITTCNVNFLLNDSFSVFLWTLVLLVRST